MKQSQIRGTELVKALAAAKKLSADQQHAFDMGKLKALRAEYYHRSQIANSGSLNGVSLININANPEYGLTNLNLGGKLPVDFVMIGMRAAVAMVADAPAALTAADLKSASYDNLVLSLGGNTKRIIDPIKNAFFKLEIRGAKEAEFAAKNFFLQGNSKQYIESDDQDIVLVPDGLKVYTKDSDVRPSLLLPEGIVLSDTAVGAGSKQYAWETTFVGFNLIIEA